MMKRREFLAAAAVFAASPGWAAAGAPDFITAANTGDRSSSLVGLTQGGDIRFQIAIPSRGHAAAVHPSRPEVVGFARRPGRFAVVLDCETGAEINRMHSPEGRHFYGHGAFSADGTTLFTTENDYDAPAGVLGVWDVTAGYRRIGEIPSGGIGPHEVLRRSDGGFVVANGGIQTHPDLARSKLNLPTMRPNLTYLTAEGTVEDQVEMEGAMHQNSIRHMDISPNGTVVIALQWQGNPMTRVPMVARHRRGEALELISHPDELALKNYAGSIAIDGEDNSFVVTGPKGGAVLYFDRHAAPDGSNHYGTASGAAQLRTGGVMITCDGGMMHRRQRQERFIPVSGADADAGTKMLSWDNHLVAV